MMQHLTDQTPSTAFDDAPSPGAIVVGLYLRALRGHSSQTLRSVAFPLRCTPAALSQMERAEIPMPPAVLKALLPMYGVADPMHGPAIQQLLPQSESWRRHKCLDPHPGARARLALCEYAATAICFHTRFWIPRAFQVPGYAQMASQALMRLDPTRPAPVPLTVPTLRPGEGQHLTLLLDEAVLMRPLGGRDVMSRQLNHLADLIERDAATILVLPFDRPAHPSASVSELVMGGGHRLVVHDSLSVAYETGPKHALAIHEALNGAAAAALSTDESYAWINRAAAALSQG
ncbi:Scr1 family TA system antitoxin-like transcriptional regulator [Streptomyces sp. NPDC057445]|uniref:Scr1 family TA system antitoxin-like transcriptional regulator n=1 Tax=Streptomyces sp. NPDC057445 TaxID=3346136 RepID=UPI003677B408